MGQIDFTEIDSNFVDGRGFVSPYNVAVDDSSNPVHVYVSDPANSRVLGWKSISEFIGNGPADLVVGQPDFYSYGCNQATPLGNGSVNERTLCRPEGLAVDAHGNLFVADQDSRVLEFSNPFGALASSGQFSNFAAITVFGQNGDFTADFGNQGMASPTAATLALPDGLAFDPYGNLYVADAVNNRVLEFQPDLNGSFGVAPVATTVFGQGGSFVTKTCAEGQFGTPTPSATNLGCDGQLAVATDASGDLFIADNDNNRVLEFTPQAPGVFANNPAASRVFGQGPDSTNFSGIPVSGSRLIPGYANRRESRPTFLAICTSPTPAITVLSSTTSRCSRPSTLSSITSSGRP